MGYEAFVLSNDTRERLLEVFQPIHPDVIAHHVTHQFGVPYDPTFGGNWTQWIVVGRVSDHRIDTLVVHQLQDGGHVKCGPSGRPYHITWSLDRSQGAKPVMSNDLIAQGGIVPVAPALFMATSQYIDRA